MSTSRKPQKWPRISIVTPSFNQGKFIEQTILSVLGQGYENLEYIVIDGGSTDNTIEVLKKYNDRISYWVSEKDAGQANAINKGFDKATGDLLAWINSDDYYQPGALKEVAGASLKSDADFFYGDAIIVDKNDNFLSYWQANIIKDKYLRFGGLIASHSAFWRKKIHQQLDEDLNCNIDGELWIRLVKGQKTKYIPKALGAFRVQPESKSLDDRWKLKWAEDDSYIEKKYGPPPAARSYLFYEYRYMQRLFKFLNRVFRRA